MVAVLDTRKRRQQADDETTQLFGMLTSATDDSAAITAATLERALQDLPLEDFRQPGVAHSEAAKMMSHALTVQPTFQTRYATLAFSHTTLESKSVFYG